MFKKVIISLILVTFGCTCIGPIPEAQAQTVMNLPDPGQMIQTSGIFKQLELKGIQVYENNPLQFDFLVDKGKSALSGQPLKDEITRLTKYFLTCLTVPEKDLWVNLSPYEKNKIAPEGFGVTEMGKSLLEQDYLLKQIMASLSYPENRLGKEFWEKVYRKVYERYGRTDIPINAFNKVWIVPQSAQVYVRGNGAFVVSSKLEVMLETDYKALSRNMDKKNIDPSKSDESPSQYAHIYAQIVRDVILPQLRQEINEGKNFAVVRQVYNAMILATWYKRHLKDSLLGKAYVGQNKVAGVDIEDKDTKEKIFKQYLKAYKKCVYNYVRDDYDPLTQTTVPRKYTSGGMDFAMFGLQGDKVYSETFDFKGMSMGDDLAMATVNLAASVGNGKIVEFPDGRLFSDTHPFKQIFRQVHAGEDFGVTGDLVHQAIAGAINSLGAEENLRSFFPTISLPKITVSNSLPEAATQQEQATEQTIPLGSSGIHSHVVYHRTHWLDISGWIGGMALAIASFGGDPVSLLATALVLPFLTRLSYASQMWLHEVLGHAVPAAVLHPSQVKRAFNSNNLKANFSLDQWLKVLLPWKNPQTENPYVLFPSQGWKDKAVRQAGFFTTIFIGALSATAVYFSGIHHELLVPLLGPLGVSAWAMIKASWSTDMKGRSPEGKFDCGNYGIFWVGTSQEGVNPSWVQTGLNGLLRRLIVRGGQSAGQSTIIDEQFSGNGLSKVYLTKVVKSKRGGGSDLVSSLLKTFGRESRKAVRELPDEEADVETPVVMGVNGHVRYATGGPVLRDASHPFTGPQEQRTQWVLKNGQLEAQEKNVIVVISHNGDNDAYRLLDREIQLDEIREFFAKVVHMEKNVWIAPYKGIHTSTPGHYDYMAPGDSPAIAPQVHFHLTQGSWRASVRFAHVMVNHKTASEAMEDILSIDQEDAVAGIFEEVFKQYAPLLSRPSLKNPAKSYKDLWVTKEMVEKDPSLKRQYEALSVFKEALLAKLESEARSSSPAGSLLHQWRQNLGTREKFVDMVVEKFFTGDRWHATQEFRQRANGSYGLVVRTSLQNDGVTIFSKAQGMALGYNIEKKFFAFASDPLVLQGPFGDKGRLDQLFILDPRGSGEVADVGLSPSTGIYMRVFSTEKHRELTLAEIIERGYPLNDQNPYYAKPVEYTDPRRVIDDDLENSTAALTSRVAAWDNPQSADRQSGEAFVELETSRYVESFFKEHSTNYSVIRSAVAQRFNDFLNNCQATPGSCSSAQMEFIRVEAARTVNDSIIARYIENKADLFLAQEADKIGADIIAGKISDEKLYDLSREIDERLIELVNEQMREITQGILHNFEKVHAQWQKVRETFKYTNPLKKTDLFISGYEKSLWLGENLKQMILAFMPRKNIEVTSSNKNLKDPFSFGIHKRTVGLIISLSGSTFPSLAMANLLKKMTGGNTFVMTSRMDAMINMALGQRLNPNAPFTRRVFLTGTYYPAEAAPTSDVLLYAEQILLVIYLVKRLKEIFPHHNPWGLQVKDADIKKLEAMVQGMITDSKKITGFDGQHKVMKDSVNQNLTQRGQYLADHLLETPKVNFLFRVFVFGVFIFGAPIQKALAFGGFDPGPALHSWMGFVTASADAFLAMGMPFLLTTLLYRTWSHRPRWARMGAPTMVIGDSPALHQIIEAYVSKLGASAPGSMTMNVHGGNPEDHFGARYAHRIVRGTEIVVGLPVDRSSQDAVVVTLKQAKGIKNGILGNHLIGGAEVTTIGRSDFVNKDATDQHINIGGQSLNAEDSEVVKKFNHLSFDPLGRLLAYKVLFNAMYAKASTYSILPVLSLNLGLFKLAVEPRKFQIWKRAWTYPSISVHTTRSPIGINEEIFAKVDKVSNVSIGDHDPQDNAMVTAGGASLENPGGIDMDSQLMNLDVKGNDRVQMKTMEDRSMVLVSMGGLIPRVSTIVSVTPGMLQAMLGQ